MSVPSRFNGNSGRVLNWGSGRFRVRSLVTGLSGARQRAGAAGRPLGYEQGELYRSRVDGVEG